MRSLSRRAWLLLVLFLCVGVNAQKVEVPQEFVDTAAKSFQEVKVLRQVVEEQKSLISAQDDNIKAKEEYIQSLKLQIEALKSQVSEYSRLKCDTFSFLFGIVKYKRCK